MASTDSVGTKIRIAQALGQYDTLGRDIVNHCVNDILPAGATPLFFLDYIGVGELDQDVVTALVGGVASACYDVGCALLGGETATLPGIYATGDFDLAGFIVGSVERNRLLTPASTQPGDALIGIPSSGLHTNGYSLVRSVFHLDRNTDALAAPLPEDGRTLGEALLEPHRQYLHQLRPVLNRIKGLAHVTGGSFHKNLPRSLAPGLAAEIDLDSWTPPPLFRFIQEQGVDAAEMYRVFNMGVGMAAIVGGDVADEVQEHIDGSWRMGRVIHQSSKDRIKFIGRTADQLL